MITDVKTFGMTSINCVFLLIPYDFTQACTKFNGVLARPSVS